MPLARLENYSGYDTEDLRRFIRRCLRVYGVKQPVHVVVTSAPRRSRGCATVGGRRMSIAIAPPSYDTSPKAFLRRLVRLLEHECAHLRGVEHGRMTPEVLYSKGAIPSWACGTRIRYRGRAPSQMRVLRRPHDKH